MENRAFNYITETSIVICPRYNRERDNDKNEKKREGKGFKRRESKEENRRRKLDIQGISDAEHTVCSSGKEKKSETKDGGGRTSDRLGANNCTAACHKLYYAVVNALAEWRDTRARYN